jgi:hypothetical protein
MPNPSRVLRRSAGSNARPALTGSQRILRDKDELRLSHLDIRVAFYAACSYSILLAINTVAYTGEYQCADAEHDLHQPDSVYLSGLR